MGYISSHQFAGILTTNRITVCHKTKEIKGITPYNVFSTMRDIINTMGRYHEYRGGYHKYRGGYLEYRGGAQYCGGYLEYHEGCSVLWGIMMHMRDIRSTVGNVQYHGWYSNNKRLYLPMVLMISPPRYSYTLCGVRILS